MDRLNSEGIARDELKFQLTRVELVKKARKVDACLLCRRSQVNEAGICSYCWVLLDDEELRLATRWLNGQGP